MSETLKDKIGNLESVPTKRKTVNIVKTSTNINLFPSQQIAIQKLEDWYRSKEMFCTLEGYAGTGKTFILKYFVDNIVDKSFTISAPTHKALRVLENIIGYKGKTLPSLLGLRPNVDLATFDPSNPQFEQLSDLKLVNYNLVMIDESSMINKGLFSRLIKIASKNNIKLLFIGDPLQLPPVKEKMSPTFTAIPNKVTLDTIIRQEEGNPLLELFNLIRTDIQNNGNSFLNYIIKNRSNIIDNKGYELLYTSDFKQRCLNEVNNDNFIGNAEKNISANIDYFRILCYTNNAVSIWNNHIRTNFLGNNLPTVCIDDLFTAYNTILNEYVEPIILNSEDYIIYDIRDYISDEGIKTFAVNLQSMYNDRKTDPFLIVDHNDSSFKKYCAILQLMYNNGINKQQGGWKTYYNFKNRFLTLVPITLKDIYGNERNIKKDIDYGFGLSVHKSQGSTFDNVAIDLTDIVWYQHPTKGWKREYATSMRNRLIYVSLSRARNKAILKY